MANEFERAKRIPPSPRLIVNGFELVPVMSDEWEVVADMWVMFGGQVVTTDDAYALARFKGWSIQLQE